MSSAAGIILDIKPIENNSAIVTTQSTVRDAWIFEQKEIKTCVTHFPDGRNMTEDQRRKIFAMCADISLAVHGTKSLKNDIRETLQQDFIQATWLTDEPEEEFSLAANNPKFAKREVASRFIDFLVMFCIKNAIPTTEPLRTLTDDVANYVYYCIANRMCVITQEIVGVEFHHTDAVGMGRNRNRIIHNGMRGFTLKRELHAEIHNMGDYAFFQKYHIEPIKLTEYLVARLWKKGIRESN